MINLEEKIINDILKMAAKRDNISEALNYIRKRFYPESRAKHYYCYIQTGSIRAIRAASKAAQFIVNMAKEITGIEYDTPVSTWCSRWPRTKQALKDEAKGMESINRAWKDLGDYALNKIALIV